uniref:uncharacterized protein LOC120342979 n=1 Tax=Styela clava TaxID=7725 RepID=UPI00193A83C6|nr:uncharacterized protein LOC120342979 [Styela clava]
MENSMSSMPPESILSTTPAQITWQARSNKKRWRIVAAIFAILFLVLLFVIIGVLVNLAFNKNNPADTTVQNTNTPNTQGQVGTSSTTSTTTSTLTPNIVTTTTMQPTPTHTPDYTSNDAKSCKELRERGVTTSGIYMIKPEKYYAAIEALCDMETDGGGWTLVASIHESDIRRKCYSDDVWSGYVPRSQILYTGQTNWDNEMIFGNVHTCSENDYKNSVYYTANASDVMVWHAQSGLPNTIVRDRATLRYRTTNKFMQNYGGNLKNLFKTYYPLTVKTDRENRTTKVLNALVEKAADIRSQIPDWYDYTYNSGRTNTISGGMFNYGPYLTFGSNRQSYGYLYYEEEYELSWSKTGINSRKSLPFLAVSVISNEDKLSEYFRINSYYRQISAENNYTYYSNTTTMGKFKLQYYVAQEHNKAYPSPCEFYFVVSNKEDWKSDEPSSFRRTYLSNYWRYRNLEMRIEGNPSHVVFGYMLLARKANLNITSDETIAQAQKVAKLVLEAFSTQKDLFNEDAEESLQVPITFDQGSKQDILNMIPPVYTDYITPGYLQFRANNLAGYPNALCPGISVQSISPEYLCIGGISSDVSDHGTCGDFAGWGGREDDSILTHQPSGSAHSHRDLFSSLLLFYR